MHFVVTAHDFSDPDAPGRRQQVRPAHLDGIRELIAKGSFLSGGAILDAKDQVVGSTLHMQFPSRAALDSWLVKEPYIREHVWDRVYIEPAKFVDPLSLLNEDD